MIDPLWNGRDTDDSSSEAAGTWWKSLPQEVVDSTWMAAASTRHGPGVGLGPWTSFTLQHMRSMAEELVQSTAVALHSVTPETSVLHTTTVDWALPS